jgi:predicted nucleic acid-binding protein
LKQWVLDASVAAKWLLPPKDEPLSAEALHLLDQYAAGDIALLVPDLFWPEIGNIVWKSVRAGRIAEATASKGLDLLAALNIPTVPTGPLLRDAFRIATTFDRTVYDSLYVALAVQAGCQLVTADERLANAMGMRLPVVWLGALP